MAEEYESVSSAGVGDYAAVNAGFAREVKYKEFLKVFPSFKAIADASNADILTAWQGLGYNRRALYLKKAAEVVMNEYKGKPPNSLELLMKLSGKRPRFF